MKYAIILIAVCILWIMPGNRFMAYAEERVIDIVYDNSGSMAFNETDRLDEADNYITRWVEADYAVRAFSALMEEDDRLYLFPMDKNREEVSGAPEENVHFYEISSPDDKDIEKASESFGNTYYAGIRNAITHLQSLEGERWIIILTDSEDKSMCEQTLNRELGNIDNIGVLYVPIAEVPKRLSLNAGIENKVIQIESKNGNIFSQILEATDYIYHRNSLTLSRETTGTIEFVVDAPIRELIVLMQAEGEPTVFQNRTGTQASRSLKEKAEVFRGEIGRETGLLLKRDSSFQSYPSSVQPSYGGNQDFADNLRIKDIQGEMIAFHGNSIINEKQIYQKTISVKAVESINLYYQLDLGMELELWQDGEKIENGELLEGEYEVLVYPINPNTGERVSADAKLLEEVSVKLNNTSCRFGERISLHASYPETVTLKAEAEGAALAETLSVSQSISVRERIYPLVIQTLDQPLSFDYNKMNQKSVESREADGIHIRILEDTGKGTEELRDTTRYYLKLEGSVNYKGLKKSEEPHIRVEISEIAGSQDEYLLYPVLTEEEDYTMYQNVKLSVAAYRTDNPEDSRSVQEFPLTLTAEKAELEANLLASGSYSGKDLASGGVAYSLICNGKELSDKEKEKLSFQTLKGGSRYVNLRQTGGGITEWLKRQIWKLYWLYNNKETIMVHSQITYVRRGIPCIAVLQGEIQVILAPLWLRVCLYVITVLLVAFLLYILFNIAAGRSFLPFFPCTLYFNNDPELGIRIKPQRWVRCLALPRCGVMLQMSENQKEAYGVECPALLLQRRKRTHYYLKNWSVFSRQDGFRINGRFIYRENAVMSKGDRFEFMDADGLWHSIVFKENLMIEEEERR